MFVVNRVRAGQPSVWLCDAVSQRRYIQYGLVARLYGEIEDVLVNLCGAA